MALLNKLERIFGRFAIPNLVLVLIVGQVLAWVALYRQLVPAYAFMLIPVWVGSHQGWWHLFSFLLMPPGLGSGTLNMISMVLTWWMLYLMGSALEGFWGTFRFNVYLLCAYLLTVGAGFLYPEFPVNNRFFLYSVFLAFAYLNPDFEIMLFYILPVKIKYIAFLFWLYYAFELVFGSGPTRLETTAIIATFLLFFGRDVYLTMRMRGRSITKSTAKMARTADPVRHRCRICNKTDVSDPQLDFRYCSKCAGDACYCADHIFTHTHVTTEPDAKAP